MLSFRRYYNMAVNDAIRRTETDFRRAGQTAVKASAGVPVEPSKKRLVIWASLAKTVLSRSPKAQPSCPGNVLFRAMPVRLRAPEPRVAWAS